MHDLAIVIAVALISRTAPLMARPTPETVSDGLRGGPSFCNGITKAGEAFGRGAQLQIDSGEEQSQAEPQRVHGSNTTVLTVGGPFIRKPRINLGSWRLPNFPQAKAKR